MKNTLYDLIVDENAKRRIALQIIDEEVAANSRRIRLNSPLTIEEKLLNIKNK